jgi:hypothetical protein
MTLALRERRFPAHNGHYREHVLTVASALNLTLCSTECGWRYQRDNVLCGEIERQHFREDAATAAALLAEGRLFK